MSQRLNKQLFYRFLILTVLLLAFWIRLWQLADIPHGLKYDEGYIAMDSAWIVETLSPQMYFVNNSGHEALYQNFAAILMGFTGIKPYTFRLGSVFIGILTIAFLYRGITYLFGDDPDRYWLGLLAATALTFSLWQVMLNRMGFQTNTVPLFVMWITYLFWRGWRQKSATSFLAAGIALGLSQYTFISARILPAIYVLFTLSWTILTVNWSHFFSRKDLLSLPFKFTPQKALPWLRHNQEFFHSLQPTAALWLGLSLMYVAALICFLPLGIFFLNNPGAYFERISQVSLSASLATHETGLTSHFLEAIHPFLIGQKNSIGTPTFTWVDQIGFWIGLFIISRYFYRPQNLFLLINLVLLWMPALLSTGGQNPTRLSGFLVIYYSIMAVGLIKVSNWLFPHFRRVHQLEWSQLVIFFLIAWVGGSTTIYTYFYEWGQSPEFDQEYESSLTELVQQIIKESPETNIIIPFQLYNYPTTRFLLHNEFREVETPPVDQIDHPTILVTLPNPQLIIRLTRIIDNSYVWLTHDSSGQGVAYISRQELSDSDLSTLHPIDNPKPVLVSQQSDSVLATLTPVNSIEPILPKFVNWSQFDQLGIDWGHKYSLLGYQIMADPVVPGQTLAFNLYWQGPTEQPWKYKTVIKFVDQRGNLFAEWRQDAFPAESFRWRDKTIVRAPHRLFISPQASPGPYLVEIEILDPSRNNLTAYTLDGQTLGTTVVLELTYITPPGTDPRKPSKAMEVQLVNQIDLLGFDPLFPLDLKQRRFRGRLYWQATEPVRSNYAIFVQLLNSQQQVFAEWESQPFAGQYPTSIWKPGEVVVQDFDLVLPAELPNDQYQLIAGMADPMLKAKDKYITLMKAKLP